MSDTAHSPLPPPFRGPWATWAIIAANVAMFVVELALGASALAPTPSAILDLGGNFAPVTLGGEPWRIASAMFLHYGILHLAMNMLCLYQGRWVERIYGHGGFLALYLVAGLVGGVASLLRTEPAVSAGASGAVFGVFGAFGAFLFMHRGSLDDAMLRRQAGSLGSFVAINFLFGVMTPGIDMGAHVGGLVGGGLAAVALILAWRRSGRWTALGRAVPVLVAVAGVALTAVALTALPVRTNVLEVVKRAGAVEDKALADFNAASQKADAGEMKPGDLADIVERDVLPPWRAAHAELAKALPGAPEKLAPMLSKYVGYFVARAEAWQVLVAYLRGDDKLEQPYKDARDHADQMGRLTIEAMQELGKETRK